MKRLAYFIVILASLLPAVALAQPSDRTLHYSGNITGQVKDSGGQPISSVMIWAECANIVQCEHLTYSAATDSSGNYKIDWLPFLGSVDSASYTLSTSKDGYKPVEANITVTHLQPLIHNFTIHASASILEVHVKDSSGKAVGSYDVLVCSENDFSPPSSVLSLKTNSSGIVAQTLSADTYYIKSPATDKYLESSVKAITLGSGDIETVDLKLIEKPAATPTPSDIISSVTIKEPTQVKVTPVVAVSPIISPTASPMIKNVVADTPDVRKPFNHNLFYIASGLLVAGLSFILYRLIKKRR